MNVQLSHRDIDSCFHFARLLFSIKKPPSFDTGNRQKISNKKWGYSRVRKKENFKLEEKWSRKMVPTDSYIFGALPSLFQHLAFRSFPFFFVHHRSHHDWIQRPSPYREFHSERSRSSFLNTIYGHNKRCYNCENRIANSKN